MVGLLINFVQTRQTFDWKRVWVSIDSWVESDSNASLKLVKDELDI